MLRKDGAVKLIDFGLARRLSELGFKATRIRGTPAYMSPEQLQGSAITPASDVYQLGVTLFELFSGQLPFREDTAMYARLVQPAPRLSTVTKVPEELDELLLYCLAIQPEERPQNAGELLPILQRILAAHGAVPVPVVSSSHAALAAVGSSQALRHLSLGQGARTPMGLGNRISELGKRPEQSSKHNAKTLSRELAPAAALRPEPEPPAAVTPTHDFDALMDDAISAMLEKDYPEALRSLRAASALRPDDARVQANLARLEELGFS
jgi:serine/threonine-protein kinase